MALFTVLEAPGGDPARVAFVPEGFSWGALLFTVVWALWHRMWMVAALLFAAFVLLDIAISTDVLEPALGSLLQIGLAVIFGYEARRLQAMSLSMAGYRHAGLIHSSCLEAAEMIYFAGREKPSTLSAPPRYRAGSDDTLGIFGNV